MRSIGQPDAGLWEIRNGWQEHPFTNLMSWAGLDRLGCIKQAGHLSPISLELISARIHAADALLRGVHGGALRNGPTDFSNDAALANTRSWAIRTGGSVSQSSCTSPASWHAGAEARIPVFYRYVRNGDFGKPEGAFVICSFWFAQALARLGRIPEARTILDHVLVAANHVGLYSEHFMPAITTRCGNLPQALSHFGLINVALAVSPLWSGVL
ncbi:MAG: hypothetical protein ACREJN_04840 [Nitrospiraceae bacterium]